MRYGAALFLPVAIASPAVVAQSPQAPVEPRFEVASVKAALSPAELGRLAAQSGGPPPTPRFGIQTQPGGRFTAGTTTLKQLIAHAFDVRDYQIDGGPAWLTTDYFEITANAGAEATPADVKAMLRTLLAERFGLRTRSDTRQAPLYNGCVRQLDYGTTCEWLVHIHVGRVGAHCSGVAAFQRAVCAGARQDRPLGPVRRLVGIPVRTGDQRPRPWPRTNSTDPLPQPLTGALQQQLGLKLEKQIGPMPVVIIDAADHPTPD